jgi:hypothetical protein
VCSGATCRDWIGTDGDSTVIAGTSGPACGTRVLTFRLFDKNNNPMPAGTTVGAADTEKLTLLTFSPDKVPSTNAIGGTIHSVTIKPDESCSPGYFSVRVETPRKNATQFQFKSN